MSSENHAPRDGQGPLRNGNRRGDPHAAPRCGAQTRAGAGCRQPAMANGRCRLHGGHSTGPRNAAGRAALAAAHTTHGQYGAEPRAFLAAIDALLRGASTRPAGRRGAAPAPTSAPTAEGDGPMGRGRRAMQADDAAAAAAVPASPAGAGGGIAERR